MLQHADNCPVWFGLTETDAKFVFELKTGPLYQMARPLTLMLIGESVPARWAGIEKWVVLSFVEFRIAFTTTRYDGCSCRSKGK